jgi:hypothetical protein
VTRVMWNLVSVRLETMLVSVQDRCMVCAKRTKAQKSFWTHPMELLGDKAQLEAHFGLFVDSANLDARLVHVLRQMNYRLKNYCGRTGWNSYVMWVMWNLILVCLEIVLVLVQNRCTVCANRTRGSKIILDAPDGTPS